MFFLRLASSCAHSFLSSLFLETVDYNCAQGDIVGTGCHFPSCRDGACCPLRQSLDDEAMLGNGRWFFIQA